MRNMMFHLLLVAIIGVTGLGFSKQANPSSPNIIGKWLGKGLVGEDVIFHFMTDNSAIWFVDAHDSPGPIRVKYSIDYSTNPVQIDIFDFELPRLNGFRLLAIIEFHGNNEMLMDGELVKGTKGVRPTRFRGDATLYTRVTGDATRIDGLLADAISVLPGDIIILTGSIVHVDEKILLLMIDEKHQRRFKFGSSRPMTLTGAHITEVPNDIIEELREMEASTLSEKVFSVKAKYWESGRRRALVFESLKDITP